jgi:hypothetical protein
MIFYITLATSLLTDILICFFKWLESFYLNKAPVILVIQEGHDHTVDPPSGDN